MADLSRRRVLAWYRNPWHLITRARRAVVDVTRVGDTLTATPSSGTARQTN
jgi:hypothetical protein